MKLFSFEFVSYSNIVNHSMKILCINDLGHISHITFVKSLPCMHTMCTEYKWVLSEYLGSLISVYMCCMFAWSYIFILLLLFVFHFSSSNVILVPSVKSASNKPFWKHWHLGFLGFRLDVVPFIFVCVWVYPCASVQKSLQTPKPGYETHFMCSSELGGAAGTHRVCCDSQKTHLASGCSDLNLGVVSPGLTCPLKD